VAGWRTLPVVWIPSGEVRELPRARMVLVQERTRLKQRVHAALAKYGLAVVGISDLFGVKRREVLAELLVQLPPQTRYVAEGLCSQIDALEEEIEAIERRMRKALSLTGEVELGSVSFSVSGGMAASRLYFRESFEPPPKRRPVCLLKP